MHRPTAAIAVLAALLLAGCSTPTETTPPPTTSSEAPTHEAPQQDGTLAFGETYTYEDGVAISVAAPEPFEPGEFAGGTDQANQVTFSFTITNGSSENLEPSAYTTVSSGGVEATPIHDMDQDVSYDPSTAVLPGQSVTWKRAWSIADLDNIVLQTTPAMFLYDEIVFTNTKK